MQKNKLVERKEAEFLFRHQNSILILKDIERVSSDLFDIFFKAKGVEKIKKYRKDVESSLHKGNNFFIKYYEKNIVDLDEDDFLKDFNKSEVYKKKYHYIGRSFGRFSGLCFRIDRCYCLNEYMWIDGEISLAEKNGKNKVLSKIYRETVEVISNTCELIKTDKNNK